MDATVAICTWNRATSLAATLESLCAVRVPSGLDWACPVVNNNCTDRTGEVLESFAEGDGPYGGNMPIVRAVFEMWMFDERCAIGPAKAAP